VKITLSFTLLLSLWLAFPLQGRSQILYEVDTLYPVHNLSPHLQIAVDSGQNLSVDEFRAMPQAQLISRSQLPKYLDPDKVYWAKLQLKSKADLEDWILDFEDVLANNIVWIRSNGRVDVFGYAGNQLLFHKKTGINYPQNERDMPQQNWVLNRVKLPLKAGQPVDLYIRVEGNSFGFFPYFKTTLRAPGFWNNHDFSPRNTVLHWVVFGVILITFIYHLLQFLYSREQVFLWFSLWALLALLTQFMAVGMEATYLLPNLPQLRVLLWLTIPGGMLFTFWLFGRVFIDAKHQYPKINKAIWALVSFMVFNIILHLALYALGAPMPFTQIGIYYWLILVYAASGLILSIVIASRKHTIARYFGAAASVAMLCILLGSMWSLHLVRLTFDPYTWGVLLQVVAYSFGIAYRQKKLNQLAQEEHLEAERNKAEVVRIKDLDEVKTRFFTNLSHEFRTPLSLILGPLKGLQNKYSGQEPVPVQAKTITLIQKNAERLQTLVDQLLELAQLESSKVQLNLKQGGVIAVLQQLVFSFESFAERKAVSLNTSFPAELPQAYYDKDKLEKIASNLLTNAIKYTPRGGVVSLVIRYDKNSLRLEISDTGEGIKQQDINKIFERFYRVEGTEGQGSGIGLALVKELVDLHNGQITVKSEVGKGTQFKVRLPYTLAELPASLLDAPEIPSENVVVEPENKVPIGAEEAPAIQAEAKPTDKPTVLIVEDNSDLRQYIADSIQHQYEPIMAEDGLQGECLAAEHMPDVIISDVMMPKMDGYMLCHSLKSNAKTSHIPVLLLTAKVTHHDKLEGLNQGADAYLTKPFDTEELLLRLNNLAESRKRLWEYFKSKDHLLIDDLNLNSLDDTFMQNFFDFVKKNLDNEELSVEAIGRAVGFSRSQLHRKLKSLTGKSATQLVMEMRLNEAHAMLIKRAGSVSEVAYSVGYSNLSYFTRSFKEKFGVLPSKVS
jgi:signal transduction histidine kinase/DNA-binding response OmpR family regulator